MACPPQEGLHSVFSIPERGGGVYSLTQIFLFYECLLKLALKRVKLSFKSCIKTF